MQPRDILRNWAKRLLLGLLLGLIFGLVSSQIVRAQDSSSAEVNIYFFWGDGCPHCAQAEPFLQDLSKRYPSAKVKAYEVWYVAQNQELMNKMAQAHNFQAQYVPTIFIGDRYWVGYSEAIGAEIEDTVKACLAQGCKDAGAGIMPGVTEEAANGQSISTERPAVDMITVPLIGTVDLAGQSLWISTALISFVDGFNPCSVWVLTMLLALTLHTGSRRKVLIIGLIFLTVTALVYALFIAGLFTVFTFINYVGWIQVIVALVALFFASVNIKDYFWYKEGISFTIADEQKPGLFKRMRGVMDASQSFWGLAGATVVMSAGVSLVEFSCTAGFPVLWTNLLAAQKVTALTFVLLLLLYMLIYQADELVIFFMAVYSLKASRLEEKQGRILKLIGGVLMLTLAGVMLINPSLMNSISSSMTVFGIAFGLVLLILLFHRRILPAFGIWIGTEQEGHKRVRRHTKKVARS